MFAAVLLAALLAPAALAVPEPRLSPAARKQASVIANKVSPEASLTFHLAFTLILYNSTMHLYYCTTLLYNSPMHLIIVHFYYEPSLVAFASLYAIMQSIRFVPHNDVAAFLSSGGVKLLFFGAEWCKFTQRFDPQYAAAEKNLLSRHRLSEKSFFGMGKVECSVNQTFCMHTHKITEGYPTTNLYIDGAFVEEFTGTSPPAC